MISPEDICRNQMIDEGYNNLPEGHPILNGKIQRFGKGKKSWYIARKIELPSGKVIVSGAFGTYHGDDNGAIKFKGEAERMSDVDRAALIQRQNEQARIEREKEEEKHRLAANRARQQWGEAVAHNDERPHAYLVKKQVLSYGLRVASDGNLLMPLWSDGGCGAELRGLQKIDSKGKKRFNDGINKVGAAYHLGDIPADAELIYIGEGYATCASVLLAAPGSFVVCAIDAGNLMPVAKHIRAAYPNAHIRFLADDDYLLLSRFIERLREQFNLSLPEPVIDGETRSYEAADGENVDVTAWWRKDAQGIDYIESDVRKGRLQRTESFKNAGLYRSHEAAAAVGNASVIHPIFSARNGEKWTDFNDLHVLESLDAVASQINAATSPSPSDADQEDPLYDTAVSVVLQSKRASISLVQRHLRIGYNRAARLIEQMELQGVVSAANSNGIREILHIDSPRPSDSATTHHSIVAPAPPSGGNTYLASAAGAPQGGIVNSAAQALQGKNEGLISAAEAPRGNEINAEQKNEASDEGATFSGARSLEWVLENCAQIYGSTDVWDSLNRIRLKRSEFTLMVTKARAKEWDVHEKRKVISLNADASAAPAAKGGGGDGKKKSKKDYGDDFWDKVDRLNKNFALIYGLDEVWDGELRQLLKINPVRLAFGNDAVKFWLNNPDRKLIPMDRVVFDPTLKTDPETSVNLFNGFGMAPAAGDYGLILELLFHLCNEDQDVFHWICCWLAYPLQNPGAKMATAIIMHGDEGSGKNLFFEKCIKHIYGEYGGIIGNAEIESQFNEWASKKLFMVCDEVVTRSELRQLKGRLKQITSNETIRINPKNMTGRDEANHINFVFLSNELQPLALDKTDRRYLVIWTPPKQPLSYYKEVAAQMFNGGNEAFYHFLLNYDVGDFNEHTQPLMTQAKADLIDLGLSPAERFYREWSGGLLPLPFVCCSAMQLYAAFCRWSYLNGERFPATQTMFGRTITRIGFGSVSKGQVKYGLGESEAKQCTVYLVGDQPEGTTRENWVAGASNLFEKALQKYRHVYESTEPNDS
ncbi:DNA translocase FtsK [Undibacterium sp. CY21W]|uniref:DNA translocase FtsK n=1 Tax=Undibacterium sp. CY21W TaxID=2762293 RepID=UPI00164A156A|nr:DNA translocase FtsK [Undibacterium sp. CY21W]MBC3927789.1 hypothetical protein [Undibacterium sp. CY21W]